MPEIVPHLVSTIIPVRNRRDMIREAIESVLAQTYRPIEIIVVDDGSTDDTPRVLEALASQHPELVVLARPHAGPGPSREAGRQVARGEFIQHLDSDDLLLPRKFELQVRALREHPECGAAYGYIRLCPADGPPRPDPFKWTGRELPTLFPWLLVDRWWNTDCPLFRRSVTDAVGPWSDLRYSQDWEYDARIGALGTRLVHCPEFVCEQRLHAGAKQTGHGGWLTPPERVRFFTSLYRSAVAGGVVADSPEMGHFSRWVFCHARECGSLGDSAAARGCYELACQAAGAPVPSDLRWYGLVSAGVGWCPTGRLSIWAESIIRRRPSDLTLKQSWMEQT